jgi:DNA-binding NarL/FixJ family response regulator
VFVIDDHRMFAASIERVLADEPDVQVVGAAGTLDEALDALVHTVVDVVLVDYTLPDSDGPLSIGSLHRAVPHAKIVVLTGMRDEAAVAAALEAGCDGYITKDRPPAELVGAIHSVMAGATAVSSDLLSGTVVRLRRSTTHPAITRREREILALVAEGVSNAKIAARLHISVNTVRNHVQSLLTKLEAHSRLEAVANAVRRGVLPSPARGS